jgi:hypothetical protein
MQRPPHLERLIAVIGRFAKRVCGFPLIPAVCVTFLLAACGAGATAGTVPAERVPAAARVLMVAVTYPPESEPDGVRPATPVSATVTDLARVRQVVGLINGLSLAPPGEEWSCPLITGGVVNLAFRNSASGRTLAAAQFNVGGCPGVVNLTIAGVQESLQMPSVGVFSREVLKLAGVQANTRY